MGCARGGPSASPDAAVTLAGPALDAGPRPVDAALVGAWLRYVELAPQGPRDGGVSSLERARADRAARLDAGLSLDEVLAVEAAVAAFVAAQQLDALLGSAELGALERSTQDGGAASDGGSRALARVAKALAALRSDAGTARRDALVTALGAPTVEALEADSPRVSSAWRALAEAR